MISSGMIYRNKKFRYDIQEPACTNPFRAMDISGKCWYEIRGEKEVPVWYTGPIGALKDIKSSESTHETSERAA
jgi:hypothetical protein